jgi:hypothetical protein
MKPINLSDLEAAGRRIGEHRALSDREFALGGPGSGPHPGAGKTDAASAKGLAQAKRAFQQREGHFVNPSAVYYKSKEEADAHASAAHEHLVSQGFKKDRTVSTPTSDFGGGGKSGSPGRLTFYTGKGGKEAHIYRESWPDGRHSVHTDISKR